MAPTEAISSKPMIEKNMCLGTFLFCFCFGDRTRVMTHDDQDSGGQESLGTSKTG